MSYTPKAIVFAKGLVLKSTPLAYNKTAFVNDSSLPYGCFQKSWYPKSSILIGFSLIFTIHFGGFPTIFGSTPVSCTFPEVCHVSRFLRQVALCQCLTSSIDLEEGKTSGVF